MSCAPCGSSIARPFSTSTPAGGSSKVPQDIGLDVNYAQWMNLQVAIDSRAVAPIPRWRRRRKVEQPPCSSTGRCWRAC